MANRKVKSRQIDVELIRQRMKERKISIRKLADSLDRSESTIRGYFKTGAMPFFVRLNAFDILGIDVKTHDEQFKTDNLDTILNQSIDDIAKALIEETSLDSNEIEEAMRVIKKFIFG